MYLHTNIIVFLKYNKKRIIQKLIKMITDSRREAKGTRRKVKLLFMYLVLYFQL